MSEQIAAMIRGGLAAGVLGEGERLPSVRALAADLLVNPNTVAKVYRELEREALVLARSGSGVSVAVGAAALARRAVVSELNIKLTNWFEEARAAGISEDALTAMIEKQRTKV